jgi:hypothetical protein
MTPPSSGLFEISDNGVEKMRGLAASDRTVIERQRQGQGAMQLDRALKVGRALNLDWSMADAAGAQDRNLRRNNDESGVGAGNGAEVR